MNWRVTVYITLAIAVPGVQSAAARPACIEENWNLPETVAICTDALALPGQTPEQQANYFFLRGLANSDGSAVKAAEAREDFEQGLRLDPNHHRMMRELGRLYFDKSDFETAYRFAHKAVTINPKNAPNWAMLGNIYETLGQADAALDAYDKAVTFDPTSVLFRANRLTSFITLRRHKDAELDAKWLLSQPKTLTDKWNKFEYRRSTYPLRVAVKLAYGRSLIALRRIPEARTHLDEAIQQFPHPTTYRERGLALMVIDTGDTFKNNVTASIKDLSEALRLDPTYGAGWGTLAAVQSLRDEHTEALKSIDKAIKFEDPDDEKNYRLYWQRAIILKRLNRTIEAVKSAQTSFSVARYQYALEDVMRPLIKNGYWKGELPTKINQSLTDAMTACMIDERCF
jgi:tetratricopeptide (TPR) repeat protein